MAATTAPPTSTPAPTAAPDPAGATEAWLQLWDGTERLVTDADAASEEMLAVASPSVVEQLATIYNPTLASDVASTPRLFENNPVTEPHADGTVAVSDCIFETPKAGNATIWYSGTAEAVDGAWTITSITLNSEIGCVPSAIARSDRRLRGVLGRPGRVLGSSRSVEPARRRDDDRRPPRPHRRAPRRSRRPGPRPRGRPTTHPEIIEVRSATEIAILDCSEQDTGRGLFVVETGERLDDIPTVRDGQRDLTSAVMVLEDGAWKVSDVQGQADVSCDSAPTPQGLPVV
ncbi:MAG: hypothetical protein R2710_27475 [Acidimicrobiales bacterium]